MHPGTKAGPQTLHQLHLPPVLRSASTPARSIWAPFEWFSREDHSSLALLRAFIAHAATRQDKKCCLRKSNHTQTHTLPNLCPDLWDVKCLPQKRSGIWGLVIRGLGNGIFQLSPGVISLQDPLGCHPTEATHKLHFIEIKLRSKPRRTMQVQDLKGCCLYIMGFRLTLKQLGSKPGAKWK